MLGEESAARRSRSARRRFGIVVLTAALASACQLIAGIDRVDKVAPGVVPTAPPPPADPCAHASPPGEPEVDDDPRGTIPPFYVAFREVRFARPDDAIPGFDLDGVCTCDRRPAATFDGGSTCNLSPGTVDCDEDGGVDNAVGRLFDTFEPFLGSSSRPGYIGAGAIRDGERTALVYIGEWNGKDNDKDVDFGFLPSQGIYEPSECNAADAGSGPRYPPGWCGKDRWSRPSGTSGLDNGKIVPLVRGRGSITNGYLTFRPKGRVTFFLGRASLTIGAPIIHAKIEVNDRGLRTLTGVLAGRLTASELLGALGQIEGAVDPLTGETVKDTSLCGTDLYPIVHQTVCNSRDISGSDIYDRSPDTACDALSAAIRFVGEEALVGEELPADVNADPCDPDKITDPTFYGCP